MIFLSLSHLLKPNRNEQWFPSAQHEEPSTWDGTEEQRVGKTNTSTALLVPSLLG